MLAPYRIPIYDQLGKRPNVKITVIHSGKEQDISDFSFEQIIIKKKKIGPFLFQFGLNKLLHNYDVIFGMFDVRWVSIMNAIFYCKKRGIPFVLWGHGMGQNSIFKKIRLFLAKKSHALLLYDLKRATPFLEGGVSKDKIFEAPNTLHIENAGFEGEIIRKDFLFVGRLYEEKLVHDLIRAFAKIKLNLREDVILHIVGEGEEKERLLNLSKELEVEKNVVFHGAIIEHDKLKEIFNKSLAYVSPGIVGLGVLHSFAYGIPVVTSSGKYHGPEFENLNKENSIIYTGDYMNLVEVLDFLLTDRNVSYNLGKNAYDYYKNKRSANSMLNGFLSAAKMIDSKILT